MRDFFHERSRFSEEPMERLMAMREFEKLQSQLKAFVGFRLRNVPSLIQANEHAKYFAHRASEAASYLAGGKTSGLRSEQLEDIQTFIEGGGRIANLPLRGRSGANPAVEPDGCLRHGDRLHQ